MKLNNGTSNEIRARFFEEADVVDGVCRWLSNGRVPFNDMLEDFLALGLITDEIANKSVDTREVETAASIQEYVNYRKENGYSAEEMFEMRAAFGTDTEVVNVFTGERISL